MGEQGRFWALNRYEALYKGTAWDDRASFWDPEVPLNERAPAVCGSDAEAMGRVLIRFTFGTARFPTLDVGESEYGVDLPDEQRAALSAGAAEIVRQARLRLVMRALLTQGLMLGSACAVLSIERGRCVARVFSAKYCTPTFDAQGELDALEISYLTERGGKHVRYRRVIARTSDTTFHERVADPDHGLEGEEWVPDPARTIEHGLGFVPAVWHRHNPDPSDCDAIDGTPLIAGLEDELFAIDMAMSQHHRNGRYNGEPQMLLTGVEDQGAPQGEQGRESQRGGVFSWLGGGSKPATKKAPGKVWKLSGQGDAKMVESSGAGAEILREDAGQLKRSVREARGIVIASPETISANASAALMRQIFEPTTAEVDNLREEYGPLLCDIVNGFFRLLASERVRAGGAFVRGFAALAPALAALTISTAEGPRWVGAPLEPAWGEYFEPTWQDVTAAVLAARSGLEGGVLTRRQAVQLVARVAHSDDVEKTVAEIEGEVGAATEATGALLDRMNPRQAPPADDGPEVTITDGEG